MFHFLSLSLLNPISKPFNLDFSMLLNRWTRNYGKKRTYRCTQITKSFVPSRDEKLLLWQDGSIIIVACHTTNQIQIIKQPSTSLEKKSRKQYRTNHKSKKIPLKNCHAITFISVRDFQIFTKKPEHISTLFLSLT